MSEYNEPELKKERYPYEILDGKTFDYKNYHIYYDLFLDGIIEIKMDINGKRYKSFMYGSAIDKIKNHIIKNYKFNINDNYKEIMERLAEEKIKELVDEISWG